MVTKTSFAYAKKVLLRKIKKMKKRIITVIFLVSMLITIIPLSVISHRGRTDSSGGHHDYNNVSGLGSYHYHHGYGAHLHPNGVCPYGGGSGSSSGYSSASSSGGVVYVTADNYDSGFDDGYKGGWNDGWKQGYFDGCKHGNEEGYQSGWDDAKLVGYGEGYDYAESVAKVKIGNLKESRRNYRIVLTISIVANVILMIGVVCLWRYV